MSLVVLVLLLLLAEPWLLVLVLLLLLAEPWLLVLVSLGEKQLVAPAQFCRHCLDRHKRLKRRRRCRQRQETKNYVYSS
jgi:hypothetical protein